MVYVDGQGNIVRPRRGIPRIWTLCAVVGVAAVMVQCVPSLAELKDHRARADGLWLSALLGLNELDPTAGRDALAALHDLIRTEDA